MGNGLIVDGFLIVTFLHLSSSSSSSPLSIGIHPLDEKYYDNDVIKCKDGLKSFTRDRLNDNFCDCPDGTDEPGTSACPAGRFYCRNLGSTPRFLYSSQVNDHICDCCDGSDENDGTFICPTTCVMGGNFAYHSTNYASTARRVGASGKKGSNTSLKEEAVQKLKGLKALVLVQVVLIILVLAFCLFRRRIKTRRRHTRFKRLPQGH